MASATAVRAAVVAALIALSADMASAQFRVTTSSPYSTTCYTTNGGRCVTDGAASRYSNNERCTIQVTSTTTLQVTEFSTERYYDRLTVNGRSYSGTSTPNNVVVNSGSYITWYTDGSVTGNGFTICASTGTGGSSGTGSSPTLSGTTLYNGASYPSGQTMSGTVGGARDYVLPGSTAYNELVSFPTSSSVVFASPSTRLMLPRVRTALTALQNVVGARSRNVVVLQAYVNGGSNPTARPTQFNQGRALRLAIATTSGTREPANLGWLAMRAAEAGFQYVEWKESGYITVATTAESCQSSVDLLIVMDGSGSLGSSGYATEKSFVQSIISFFNVGAQATRIAVMTFSSSNRLDFDFDHTFSRSTMQSLVSNLRFPSGGTNTAGALQLARTMFASSQYGARTGVPKVCVVITDGQSNSRTATATAAAQLKADGVSVYAIGAGSGISQTELRTIASTPSSTYVHLISQVANLNLLAATITSTTCNTPQAIVIDEGTVEATVTVAAGATSFFSVACPSLSFPGSSNFTLGINVRTGSSQLFISGTERNPGRYDATYTYQANAGTQIQIAGNDSLAPDGAIHVAVEGGSSGQSDLAISVSANALEALNRAIPITLPFDQTLPAFQMIPAARRGFYNSSQRISSPVITWDPRIRNGISFNPTTGFVTLNPTALGLPSLSGGQSGVTRLSFWVTLSTSADACVYGNATVELAFFTPPSSDLTPAAYCSRFFQTCGPTSRWANYGDCLNYVTGLPEGAATDEYGQTLGCGQFHLGAAESGIDPFGECRNADLEQSAVCSSGYRVIINFNGDCTTLTSTTESLIKQAVNNRKATYPFPLKSPIDFSCGSVVATVTLPASVSNESANAFANSVNSSAIFVPGTTMRSQGARVEAIPPHTGASGSSGGGGGSDNTGVIAGVVVVVLLLVLAAVGFVIWKKKKSDGDAGGGGGGGSSSRGGVMNVAYEPPAGYESSPQPPPPKQGAYETPAPATKSAPPTGASGDPYGGDDLYEDADPGNRPLPAPPGGESFDGFAEPAAPNDGYLETGGPESYVDQDF